MPSFASYLDILINEGPSSPQYARVTGYTSYLEYRAAELQREIDRHFLEETQWTTTKYEEPEGFKTIELNSNVMLVEGSIVRIR